MFVVSLHTRCFMSLASSCLSFIPDSFFKVQCRTQDFSSPQFSIRSFGWTSFLRQQVAEPVKGKFRKTSQQWERVNVVYFSLLSRVQLERNPEENYRHQLLSLGPNVLAWCAPFITHSAVQWDCRSRLILSEITQYFLWTIQGTKGKSMLEALMLAKSLCSRSNLFVDVFRHAFMTKTVSKSRTFFFTLTSPALESSLYLY